MVAEKRDLQVLRMRAKQAVAEGLFAGLSPDRIDRLVEGVELVELDPDAFVFRQGDRADTLYVVAEGNLEVYKEGDKPVHLACLGAGEFFGEIGLVTDQQRSASVRAIDRSWLLAFDRDTMAGVIEEDPEVLTGLLRFVRQRLFETLVRTSPLFGSIPGVERRALAERFNFFEVVAGAELITQGDESSAFHILLSGSAEVRRSDEGETRVLAVLGPGDQFGEMSLLADQGATATVVTTERCILFSMPAETFKEVVKRDERIRTFLAEMAVERHFALQKILAGSSEERSRLPLL